MLTDPITVLLLLLFFTLLGCSAFFSASEVAFFSLNQIHLEQMEKNAHPRLDLVRNLLRNPRALIATILIGNEFVNVAASNISATLLIRLLGGEAEWWINILIMLPLLLLFGEITPKTLALRYNVVFATMASPSLTLFDRLVTPVRIVVAAVASFFVTKMIGKAEEKKTLVTEEMVRSLAEHASTEGALDDAEHTYINSIFNFGNLRVQNVMVPRAKIFFLPHTVSLTEAIRAFQKTGLTRIPVYQGHHDDVVGVLHVRDLILSFSSVAKNPTALLDVLREPYFVTGNRLLSSLFHAFKEHNKTTAMVVDEYGGVIGLVTRKDLLKTIFGNIDGVYRFQDTLPATKDHVLVDGCWELEGVLPLAEFSQITGCEFEEVLSETLGGAVLDLLGELPAAGRKISLPGWTITVLRVEKNRIAKLRVCHYNQDDETTVKTIAVVEED